MPDPIRVLTSRVALFDADDVDTDQIFPAQFLKVTERKGLSKYLFYRWRYDEAGNPLGSFILDVEGFRDSKILLTGRNFGIGSSRENAVWALTEFGIRCVISSSFGDIFYNNASKNGLLCVRLGDDAADAMRNSVREGKLVVSVDLEKQTISYPGNQFAFEIEPHIKERLLRGADDIAFTINNYEEEIRGYEARMPKYMLPFRP
ncbi:MAG: 3-isopropylmalate dehydratase small subunit [Thaumarchaeota archaeon]|nr:3-isopropylmalate dehydratase small subunit [Nitrososphaerota archaeon]